MLGVLLPTFALCGILPSHDLCLTTPAGCITPCRKIVWPYKREGLGGGASFSGSSDKEEDPKTKTTPPPQAQAKSLHTHYTTPGGRHAWVIGGCVGSTGALVYMDIWTDLSPPPPPPKATVLSKLQWA